MTLKGKAEWASDDDASIARALGALRYARCHAMRSIHGIRLRYLGVHEFWWPTLSAFERGVTGAPEAWAELEAISGPSTSILAHAERLI